MYVETGGCVLFNFSLLFLANTLLVLVFQKGSVGSQGTDLHQREHKPPCSCPPWLLEPSSARWQTCQWHQRSGCRSVSPDLEQNGTNRDMSTKTFFRTRLGHEFSASTDWVKQQMRRDTRVTGTHTKKKQNPVRPGRVWESSACQTKGTWVGFASRRKTLPSQVQTAVSCVTDQGRLTCPPPRYGNTKVKHAPCLPTVKPYPQGGREDKAHFTWHR